MKLLIKKANKLYFLVLAICFYMKNHLSSASERGVVDKCLQWLLSLTFKMFSLTQITIEVRIYEKKNANAYLLLDHKKKQYQG